MIIDRIDEEFLLFSLHPDGTWVSYKEGSVQDGLAGAWLAELLVDGRIKIKGDRIHHRGHSPVDDEVLDGILEDIRHSRPRKIDRWIGKLVPRTRKAMPRVMVRLQKRGYVDHIRVRTRFGRRKDRFPTHDVLARKQMMDHLNHVLSGQTKADEPTLALLAVLEGAGMLAHVFGEERREHAHERIHELLRQDQRFVLLGTAIKSRNSVRWLRFIPG